jgi:RNA-directed DNA polymerase
VSDSAKPQGKAMYVATGPDKDWLLSEQRKLYARSYENHVYVFRKLWGLITDSRNLRIALARAASNRGRRTAGVDGQTVRSIVQGQGAEAFLTELRQELRSGAFRPAPVRRVLIPKPGQPGKFRPLGIPTVKDRVIQAALKNILEPIFEADFFPSSYGFRPGTGAHAALEQLRMLLFPKAAPKAASGVDGFPYQWAIEGDIKGCFDNIDHHGLMTRLRRRIGDAKVSRIVLAFLKADILANDIVLRGHTGTPQGGILSPLLANIALSALDERYERYVWPRRFPTLLHDRRRIQLRAGNNRNGDRNQSRAVVMYPVRYADDFIVLVGAPPGRDQYERAREAALTEKAALAKLLKETLDLELSESKTAVTPVTRPMRFLGHHVRVQRHPLYGMVSKCVIPKDRSHKLRSEIKRHLSRQTLYRSLADRLSRLNPVLRGWGGYYRHAWGAKQVFACLDRFLWYAVRKWIRAKHKDLGMRRIYARYGWKKPGGRMWRWRDGSVRPFELTSLRVERYSHGWSRPPSFTSTLVESPVRNESRTPGSAGGARKPAGASRRRRRAPT